MNYDKTSPLSIEQHAILLEGKTFQEVIDAGALTVMQRDNTTLEMEKTIRNKGDLGQLIERYHFLYECNSDSAPDFPEAGVELKVTPYKENQNGTFSAKERLFLTKINYFEVVKEQDVFSSHLWYKCRLILLIYYKHIKTLPSRYDYEIKYARLFTPPQEDLLIISSDFDIIVNKIRDGRAHLLSDSDTVYLSASTKSAKSTDRTSQPFNSIQAKPRGFAYKTKYMTYVLNHYILGGVTTYEPIIQDISILKERTFEEIVLDRLSAYTKRYDRSICKSLNIEWNPKEKSIWSRMIFRILGARGDGAEEFEKAGIEVKTVRLKRNGKIEQSMSFPAIKFKKLAKQEFEDSDVFEMFAYTKFLFVVFEETENGFRLKGSMFWQMPEEELFGELMEGWENIRNRIRDGVTFIHKGDSILNDIPGMKDNRIIHMRPHAKKSAYMLHDGTIRGNISCDADELPDGQFMTKQCFWLKNTYIEEIVSVLRDK